MLQRPVLAENAAMKSQRSAFFSTTDNEPSESWGEIAMVISSAKSRTAEMSNYGMACQEKLKYLPCPLLGGGPKSSEPLRPAF